MKPSSCRAAVLHWSRLKSTGMAPRASSHLSFSTLTEDDRPVAAAVNSAASRTFSTVMQMDDEGEDLNDVVSVNKFIARHKSKSQLKDDTMVTRHNDGKANTTSWRKQRDNIFLRNNHVNITASNIAASTLQKQHDTTPPIAAAINSAASNTNSQKIPECTCGFQKQQEILVKESTEPLPPPLPQPLYSVHKRVLPPNLTALSSPLGRRYLLESMAALTAESYWALTEQFVNQSDPAYCGVTTLLMVSNAMNLDPNVRWKGGWRFYGDEDVLLQRCCLNTERIRRVGITMEQFMILGTCHGMRISLKRPPPLTNTEATHNNINADDNDDKPFTLEEFRRDLRETLDSNINNQNAMMVTSFSRSALQQTGDGHYSPIAAYHEESDQVLVLDVARFKYAPYWVSVEELYRSMQPLDEATDLPRGWYLMKPPARGVHHSYEMTDEDRRPAHLVPLAHEKEPCPVGEIKVQFCPAKGNGQKGGTSPKELQ